MEKFTKLTGVAAPMDAINVDTDQIIPKLHLRTIKRTGLGKVLFDELRFDPDGSEKPEFVLNQTPYREAKILVAGDNFGCGSSREHAPQALRGHGFRAFVGGSFAEIFFGNCTAMGLVCTTLADADLEALMNAVELDPSQAVTIDVQRDNRARPERALEVLYASGQPMSRQATATPPPWQVLETGAAPEF